MAHFTLLTLLITLLSSIHTHARESQFFYKALTTTNNDVVPNHSKPPQNNNQQQEPSFLPDKENGHGLYARDSGKLHPSAATTNGGTATPSTSAHKTDQSKQPFAYVDTDPEDDISESTTFTDEKRFTTNTDNDNLYGGAQNYHNNPHEEDDSEYRNYPTATKNRNGKYDYYYNGDSSFNRGAAAAAALSSREESFNHGGAGSNGYEPQGMSDTRVLENGKYFYDVNTDKYSSNHPYESLKGVRERNEKNNKNYYGHGENGYEFNGGKNSMGGFQNQYEFQDEEKNNLRP